MFVPAMILTHIVNYHEKKKMNDIKLYVYLEKKIMIRRNNHINIRRGYCKKSTN